MARLQPSGDNIEALRSAITSLELSNKALKEENQALSNERKQASQNFSNLHQLLLEIQQEVTKHQAKHEHTLGLTKEKDQQIAVLERQKARGEKQIHDSIEQSRMSKERERTLEHEVQWLLDANKRGAQLLAEAQGDVKRLSGLNKEKENTIKNLEIMLSIRTKERDQAQEQYEYVQNEFVQCQERIRDGEETAIDDPQESPRFHFEEFHSPGSGIVQTNIGIFEAL